MAKAKSRSNTARRARKELRTVATLVRTVKAIRAAGDRFALPKLPRLPADFSSPATLDKRLKLAELQQRLSTHPTAAWSREFQQALSQAQLEDDETTLQRTTQKQDILRRADKAAIRQAITDVYDGCDQRRTKPPNIKELPAQVRLLLHSRGLTASNNRISTLGDAPEFKKRRGRVGVRRT
jgi:hypothetical protein